MDSEEQRLKLQRHARIRRVKQVLRWLPRRSNLDTYPVLKWFARHARKRPFLWSFKVPNVSPAFYAGSILAFLPLYGAQLVLAFFAAILFRANLPILCGLQLISNPFTVPIIYWFNVVLGRRVIRFFTFGGDPGMWDNWMFSMIVGGFFIGLAVGIVLDLLYRIGAWQGEAQYRKLRAYRHGVTDRRKKHPPPPPEI